MPQIYLDQIADFITKNAQGVELGQSTSQYHDPFTGKGHICICWMDMYLFEQEEADTCQARVRPAWVQIQLNSETHSLVKYPGKVVHYKYT